MKERLLEILCCPQCKDALQLIPIAAEGDEVLEGILWCACGQWFPVTAGVPRMFVSAVRPDYGDFYRENRGSFPAELKESVALVMDSRTVQKKATQESFGYEWEQYSSYGWKDKDRPHHVEITDFASVDLEQYWSHTYETFWRKSLFATEDLKGKTVLDVGVGNGRYAQVALESGAEVIGIDLSHAAEVAFRNTGGKVQTIQCDVFNLPFRDESFDCIYSIGVLHHSPDTKSAFLSLLRILSKGGLISVHLYKKGNPVYELVDRAIRSITTKLPLRALWFLCLVPTLVGKILYCNRYLFSFANSLAVLRTQHHFNFDWYSAPIAYHHTEAEVEEWYEAAGLGSIVSDDPTRNADSYSAKIYPSYLKTGAGTVKKAIVAMIPNWSLTVRGKR